MPLKLRLKEFFRTLHHRKWVRVILYILINVGLPIVGTYANFIEVRRLSVSRIPLPIKKNLKLKIAQLSDIHMGPTNNSVSFLQRAIRTLNNQKPDIILLTGDFLQWDMKYSKALANILASLKAPLGVYASLGNHDYGVCHPGEEPHDPVDFNQFIADLKTKGIKTLHNHAVVFENYSTPFNLVGLGDLWTSSFKPEDGFKNINPHYPTILMSHNPDSFEALQNYPFDLMLSGHVHGGQISFPFIGPLVVPVKHRHLRRGLHEVAKDKWLYTNRGLGYTLKARFLSIPEIAIIDITGSFPSA
ncbi:metallophosphoesterase [bacterium]|nr:metallophosphoesterase [bacterium]